MNSTLLVLIPIIIAIGAMVTVVILLVTRRPVRPIRELVEVVQRFTDGDWEARARVMHNDETGLLASSFNKMADELLTLYQSLESKIADSNSQITAMIELSQIAGESSSLDDILAKTAHLILNRFKCEYCGIYLADESRENAILYQAAGPEEIETKFKGIQITINSLSLIGWVIGFNRSRLDTITRVNLSSVRRDDLLPETKIEAGVPITYRGQVLGMINIQSFNPSKITLRDTSELHALANQIAPAVRMLHMDQTHQTAEMGSKENHQALQDLRKTLAELQILNAFSQAISMETDLNQLYKACHTQIARVMGEVDFLIALYDAETNLINIPYLSEKGNLLSVAPFPLGDGLTSILIRTAQPLLLVEDTENRARELGAKVLGAPAKSWMGVPLIIGGEAVGAIVVQDTEREHRFNEDDQRLLSTLAAQMAIAVRNARLLEETNRRARNEQLFGEITARMRQILDKDELLRTATSDIRHSLGLKDVSIKLWNLDD